MQPEHKFATATKLCHEVLQAVADGNIGLDEGQDVLGDALAVLTCKEIKVSASRGAAVDDDGGAAEEGSAAGGGADGGGQVGAIKRGLVSSLMKKHLVEAVVPLLVELKRQLEAEHHPLLRSLRECFCALLKARFSRLYFSLRAPSSPPFFRMPKLLSVFEQRLSLYLFARGTQGLQERGRRYPGWGQTACQGDPLRHETARTGEGGSSSRCEGRGGITRSPCRVSHLTR